MNTNETIDSVLIAVCTLAFIAALTVWVTYRSPTRPGEIVVEGGLARCVCPEVRP